MTGRMVKIRNIAIFGVIALLGVIIFCVLNHNTKEVTKETVNKEMESMQSSLNDEIMSGVIEYLNQVMPENKAALNGINGEAYNKILETVNKSMQDSLQDKLDGTLTTEDVTELENDITAIVRKCVSEMSFDASKPVKGVDYFTDGEIETISKTVSTIVESNMRKELNSDVEGNATSLSVLKATINSNIDSLKTNVKSYQDDVESMKSKMDGVSSSGINDLKTKYASLNSSLNTYKTSADTAIKSASDKADAAKVAADSVTTTANTAKTTAEAAQTASSTNTSAISSIQSELQQKVSMEIKKDANGVDTLTITSGVKKVE